MWIAIGLTLGLSLMVCPVGAETPGDGKPSGNSSNQFIGSVVGFVGDQGGVPQMGASVLLYGQNETLAGRAITNEKGAFGFDGLAPGHYSVRVSMASFVPALKQDIRVLPGMRTFLSIDLASVLFEHQAGHRQREPHRIVCNACGVNAQGRFVTSGALRDPGLWSLTPAV